MLLVCADKVRMGRFLPCATRNNGGVYVLFEASSPLTFIYQPEAGDALGAERDSISVLGKYA
jgi:hypothetical protein